VWNRRLITVHHGRSIGSCAARDEPSIQLLVVLYKHSRIFGKIILHAASPRSLDLTTVVDFASTFPGTETPPMHATTRVHNPKPRRLLNRTRSILGSWQITRSRRSLPEIHPASAESPPRRHHPAHRIGRSPGFLPQLWGTPTFLTYARWDAGAWVTTV
jgi:hypothetical protein